MGKVKDWMGKIKDFFLNPNPSRIFAVITIGGIFGGFISWIISSWLPFSVIFVIVSIYILWAIPICQVRKKLREEDQKEIDRDRLENEFRKTLAQILGGIVLIFGGRIQGSTARHGR